MLHLNKEIFYLISNLLNFLRFNITTVLHQHQREEKETLSYQCQSPRSSNNKTY